MSESAETLRDNDIRLAELARGISAAQWSQPSLCTEWTNHEVLAHLVIGYQVALSAVAAGILRSRGSFNATNTELARRLAAERTPDQLIVDFTGAGAPTARNRPRVPEAAAAGGPRHP